MTTSAWTHLLSTLNLLAFMALSALLPSCGKSNSSISMGITDHTRSFRTLGAMDRQLSRLLNLTPSWGESSVTSKQMKTEILRSLMRTRARVYPCLFVTIKRSISELAAQSAAQSADQSVDQSAQSELNIAKIDYQITASKIVAKLGVVAPISQPERAQEKLKACLSPLTHELSHVQVGREPARLMLSLTLKRGALDLAEGLSETPSVESSR